MADEKFWQRRESRHLRGGRNYQKAMASNILEALSGGDAAANGRRMKFTVRKEDLKQLLEAIRDTRGGMRRGSAAAAEQRLSLLRRRQILRVKSGNRVGMWRPVLQTIPE